MKPVNDRLSEPNSNCGPPATLGSRGGRQGWILAAKLVLLVVIFGLLIRHMLVSHPEAMRDLWNRPKSLPGIALATLIVSLAVAVSFLRWYVLVAALELPVTLSEAIRLGLMGYFMNFVSAGGVGGDLFKAAFLVRQLSSRRSAALATIALDRFVGLYSLVLLACCVAPFAGRAGDSRMGPLIASLPVVAALATVVGIALLVAMGTDNGFSHFLRRIPYLETVMHDLVVSARVYRSRWQACLIALGLSLFVHVLVATAHFSLAQSLLGHPSPTLAEHLVMTPLACAAGGLPLTPGGLGTYEMALTYLFDHFPRGGTGAGRGFAVALGYRLETLLIAAVGMIYCGLHRKVDRSSVQTGTT